MSRADLIRNATQLVSNSSGTQDLTTMRAKMEQALPYLIELAEAHPNCASAPWVNTCLAKYLASTVFRENKENPVAALEGISATAGASVDAALARYELVAKTYPDSPQAEEAVYGVASMKWIRARAGLGGDDRNQALVTYEGFLNRYPNSRKAPRARMCAASLRFELAKTGKMPIQDAYTAMQQVLDASPTLTSQELGRVQLMLAEMQEFYLHDSPKAIQLASRIDLSPSQDKATASSALYIIAHAHRNLGNYTQAVPIYQRLLSEFGESEWFGLPLHPVCIEAMGDCLMKVKDWDGAKAAFTRLKQEHPNDSRTASCDEILKLIENERSKGQ